MKKKKNFLKCVCGKNLNLMKVTGSEERKDEINYEIEKFFNYFS